MDELTDRLEHAARSAVDRLRRAVAANEAADGDEAGDGQPMAGPGDEPADDDADGPTHPSRSDVPEADRG
jgi:hypothetical protein